jgi:hypothetical protein
MWSALQDNKVKDGRLGVVDNDSDLVGFVWR